MRDGAHDAGGIALSRADLVWAAGSLCNLARLPFSPALLQRECPPPCSAAQLVAALAGLGLRARIVTAGSGAPAPQLPAIAFLHPDPDPPAGAAAGLPGNAATGAADRERRVALLVKADGERVLLFRAGSNEPTTLSSADYRAQATRAPARGRGLAGGAGRRRGCGERRRASASAGSPTSSCATGDRCATCSRRRSRSSSIALAAPLCSQIDHRQGDRRTRSRARWR